MNDAPISIQTTISAPVSEVWTYWNEPKHIENWAFATDDWEAHDAENDVRVGGKFKTIMSAKDKSASFAFTGTYTSITEHGLIEYTMDDGRKVRIEFTEVPEGTRVVETFDPESENSRELQKNGWQSILDNFKKYVEAQ